MTQHSNPKTVIYDGDMGGDDMIALMMLLGHPERFRVAGITTVLGNVDCDHATRNVLDLLGHFNIRTIPVHQGAARPVEGAPMFGDGAYGENGIGGVILNNNGLTASGNDAAAFIVDTVRQSPDPVTIFATGPQTNLARALASAPDIRGHIETIIAFGGAIAPGPHPDTPERIGNITLNAEFNFFQDPYAANIVLNSGADIRLLTLDASQNIHFSPQIRQQFAQSAASHNIGDLTARMLAPAEALDRPKFGVDGPFIHDPNVVIYALDPALYTASAAFVQVEEHPDEQADFIQKRHGRMQASFAPDGPVTVVNGMARPQEVIAQMETALQRFGRTVSPRP